MSVRGRGTVAALVLALLLPGVVPLAAPPAGAATDAGPDAAEAVGPVQRGDAGSYAGTGPVASDRAHVTGAWSKVADWPLGAIHAVLLPDGRVMTYGTDGTGRPSYGFEYDVWDPAKGLGAASHTTLPVRTRTNLFCSAQTVLTDGRVLLTGGEEHGLPGGGFNDAVTDVNVFDPATDALARLGDEMAYPRWYPTATTLPNGDVLVHGGRDDRPGKRPILVPEVYSQVNGWRRLPGARSAEVYDRGRWWYPRSWVAPDGTVLIVTQGNRGIYELDPRGRGSVTRVGSYPAPTTDYTMPAAMFDVGKVLITRKDGRAAVIDVTGARPKVTGTGSLRSYRSWSDATVLADGRVMVSGGASRRQLLAYATNHVELWDPDTGRWRTGAAARRARLYHSTSLLLPDATVLTVGGGPPGPVTNLNAEIYHPPYLFARDGSGRLARRPRITAAGAVGYDGTFPVDVADAGAVSKVALIRTGSVTHSFDMDQRFMELDFTQAGDRLTVTGPRTAAIAPPGRYLLFVFDDRGVPSVARIVELAPSAPQVSAGVQSGSLTVTRARGRRWVPVRFERAFTRTPVVAVGAASTVSGRPAMARVRRVTTHGFEVALDTWPSVGGTHTFETLSFIAAEPGRHRIGGATLHAGAVTAGAGWSQARFGGALPTTPVVLPQLAGDVDPRAATVRVRSVGAAGVQLRLQGQEADERRGRRHGREVVHYLAVTPGRGAIDGRPVWTGVTRVAVTHEWKTIRFGRSLATPRLVAAAQTTRAADPVLVRHRRLRWRGAEVRVQEERSHDRERRHGRERVGYVAIGAR